MRYKRINVSEIPGYDMNVVMPSGTLFVDPEGRIRVSDGVTQGGISPKVFGLKVSGAGTGVTLPDGARIVDSGFYAGPNQNAVIGQSDGNTQVYTMDSGIGLQTYKDTYKTFFFSQDGYIVFPDGTTQSSAYTGIFTDGYLVFPDSTTQSTAWTGGRVVATPSISNGTTGDLKGDIAFDGNHIYYCSDNFGGTVVSIETYTSSGITRSYFIAYSDNPGFTSADLTGYSVSGPGYTGTVTGPSVDQGGNLWYIPVSPNMLQQMGTYVFTSPGNIWKRVAWSNDTW